MLGSVESERWGRLVGGHLALDFVNTDIVSEHDRSEDVLRSADEFVAWCVYAAVPGAASTAPTGGADDVLADALSLREALRASMRALAAGETPKERDLATVQAMYARALGSATMSISGGVLSWRWAPGNPLVLVWEIAVQSVDLLRGGSIDRIKACPACGFVFIDATKNRSRRWCSMDDCGKQEKIRRYVTKRAQAR